MKIELLQRCNILKAANLIGDSFANHEPLSKHLGLSRSDFSEWASKVIASSLKEDLTFVAVDDEGEIIGCIVAEPFDETIVTHTYPSAEPIFDMLKSLYKNLRIVGKVLHVVLIATDSMHINEGVCYKLVKYILEKAKELGYTQVVAELTAKGTQQVFFQKLKFFQLGNRINYSEYGGEFANCHGEAALAYYDFKNFNFLNI